MVITSHGYTGVKHFLLGSTAEHIVRCAPCPVLVIHEKNGECHQQNMKESDMKIRDIETQNPEVIHPDADLFEAAQKMKKLDVGLLPVCDGERLVGMVSDRDITIRGTAEGRDPKQTKVRDVMTPEVVYCYDDQDVKEAAEIMQQRQIRRLPVLNHNKRLVGIVSLGDIAVRTKDERCAGETLERVSESA
jgi:CBS domain-containing protein